MFEILKADLENFVKYSKVKSKIFTLVTVQGAWAVGVYRFGNFAYKKSRKNKLWYFNIIIWYILNKIIEILTGISIDFRAQIEKGFMISHFGNIIISGRAKIGKNFAVGQGVTIGRKNGLAPTIGDNVYVGVNAVLIGDISIGDNSKIGALALVNKSFPENSIIVGNPAINKNKN